MREPQPIVRETTASVVRASPMAGLISVITSPWGGRIWLRVYAVSLAMATFLSLIGALGSEDIPLIPRFGYWLVTVLGGTVATQLVSLAVCRLKLEPLPEALVLFVASTPGIVVTVWVLTQLYWGHGLIAADLPDFVIPVTVITLVMSALHYAFNRRPRQSHVFPHALNRLEADQEPGGRFRQRLPFKYRDAEIFALSAEDHYLRVHTSAGETLILMRLGDAIRELDGIEGSQTHRSWWVAKGAITEVMRTTGRITLTIKGRTPVPVSRSYAKALKAGGWFDLPARTQR